MKENLTRKKALRALRKYKLDSPYSKSIKRIGLFGSAARKSNTTQSDVDVFVELDPPRMFDLIGIKQDLETIFRSKVDIVVLRKNMNGTLRNQIESHGVSA